MLFVANYTMKGPSQALLATLILAMLSIFFAPFGLLLGAVIALVTLRVGEIEGLKTLMLAMLANYIVAAFVLDSPISSVVAIFEYMLPIWLIALVLRKTNSLASAIHLAMIMASVGVVAFHLIVGDSALWWQALFKSIMLPVIQEAGVEIPSDAIAKMASVATLVIGMLAVFLWVSIAFIARWWQSQLYYPGRFGENFYQIRLPNNIAYFAAAVVVASLVVESALMKDLAAVLIAGLLFPGIAIAHYTVATQEMSKAWLIALYFLLFLFPQTIFIVAVIGLIDTWLDIRNRWVQR